jgi:hypothetical protein
MSHQSFFPKKFEKKIKKEIRKTFDLKKYDIKVHAGELIAADENIIVLDVLQEGRYHGYALLTKAKGCLVSGCTSTDISEHSKEGFYEEYFFLSIYDIKGILKKVKILEYESNYGYEIASSGWLNQFKDRQVGNLEINGEIDGITGATISVKSLISEVNYQKLIIDELIKH